MPRKVESATAGTGGRQASVSFVDLFSGAGGMACGFEQAGMPSLFASDNWHAAAETYRENHPGTPFIEADIRDLPVPETPMTRGTLWLVTTPTWQPNYSRM